jgi:ATP-dependent Lon protease
VIPRDNEADLDDLPDEVLEKIKVTGVDTLAEALAITLRDTSIRDGRLFFATAAELH